MPKLYTKCVPKCPSSRLTLVHRKFLLYTDLPKPEKMGHIWSTLASTSEVFWRCCQ
jgi:hypothetical protein